MSESLHLTKQDIAVAFNSEMWGEKFPPVMDVKAVARMLSTSPKCIYNMWEAGRLKGTGRRQGKRLRFWRDRVIEKVFNGPEWAIEPNNKVSAT